MKLVRRHPIAFALAALVLLAALWPLPSLVDAVTGQPPGDADLLRPLPYLVFAPLSDTLDALTFLSQSRAWTLVLTWVVALGAWGALLPGTRRRRLVRAGVGVATPVLLAAATVVLPRPVPRLATTPPRR